MTRIAETIAIAGMEPGMRDADFRDRHRSFDNVVGVEAQRAVNASSIARATGIPRETVRRKLLRLLKLGFIVEKGRARYILNPGAIQSAERQVAFAAGLEETIRWLNDALAQGVLRWLPAKA